MIEQTINGKPVIIIDFSSMASNNDELYLVSYDGDVDYFPERPVTDQDMEKELKKIKEESLAMRGRLLGIAFSNIFNSLSDP